MYCVRNVTSDLYWVGANDHRLALFENCFPIPRGVSYNAYCLLDEKTVLFDTADASVCRSFLENVAHGLGGRALDYLVVQHMEPDHAADIRDLLTRHPVGHRASGAERPVRKPRRRLDRDLGRIRCWRWRRRC